MWPPPSTRSRPCSCWRRRLKASPRSMAPVIDERPDGVSIRGPAALHGATVESHGDHRVAMALAVAALTASGPTTIEDADCVAVSYPNFFAQLQDLTHES